MGQDDKPHKLCTFKINGKDESELHGKQYRVLLKKLADKKGVKGSVRNIKYKSQIEVKLDLEDKAQAEEIRKFMKEELETYDQDTQVLEFGELCQIEDDMKYDDFSVIREDELTEMVWALQGAGDVFYKSSKDIRNVMITRDARKERGLLAALKLEVGLIKKTAEDMIKDLGESKPVKFNFEHSCLQKALVEPAWADNDDFLQLTSDLFHLINRHYKAAFQDLHENREKINELENLKKVASEYYGLIETRLKDLDA